MTSAKDNDVLTRVGRGTPMGDLMRQYWIPACLSSELEAGAAPMRLMLLGEKLIAFRDSAGRVGIMDHRCPHRCASLFFGRNEEGGLRCIYHGWKFAVDGTVLETPNVADPKFKSRLKGRTYPVREAGGLLWGYLGPKELMPAFPEWEFMKQPEAHRINAYAVVNCNFVQVIEGLVDSSHLWWDANKRIGEDPLRAQQLTFVGLDEPTLVKFGMTPETCDTEAAMSWRNGYGQDRALQRSGHFTGLHTFTQEDAGCSISSGAIRDRSKEMLSSADVAITQLYRSLLGCARAARDGRAIAALEADVGRVVGTSAKDIEKVLSVHTTLLHN